MLSLILTRLQLYQATYTLHTHTALTTDIISLHQTAGGFYSLTKYNKIQHFEQRPFVENQCESAFAQNFECNCIVLQIVSRRAEGELLILAIICYCRRKPDITQTSGLQYSIYSYLNIFHLTVAFCYFPSPYLRFLDIHHIHF